ncbi:hypothetical protein TNCT_303491 [Trichonephila clavata]|uniref:Uncharacterized protein n=1 Tax=Trichonephila clavata TaxID=2740835 RepID=A0A8X6FC99_TRICU|nr:hypothetical protein TNCT_303491 [Trichonephila clavata]
MMTWYCDHHPFFSSTWKRSSFVFESHGFSCTRSCSKIHTTTEVMYQSLYTAVFSAGLKPVTRHPQPRY